MTTQLFNGVDHIMVRVEKTEPLLALFSDRFSLPTSWPLQHMEFATYAWITLGNTNLEFWAASDNSDLPAEQSLPLFSGFALDPPSLSDSVEALAKRGIACKTPRAFVTPGQNGERVTNFTNAVILDVSTSTCCVFFCEWGIDGTIFPWTGKLTAQDRRLREQHQFDQCGGGPLGVIRLSEITMATPDLERATQHWQAITGQASDTFDLGRGIVLTLHAGEKVEITSIVLAVKSLAVARDFLESQSMLGDDRGDEISIGANVCPDLCIRLKEVF